MIECLLILVFDFRCLFSYFVCLFDTCIGYYGCAFGFPVNLIGVVGLLVCLIVFVLGFVIGLWCLLVCCALL